LNLFVLLPRKIKIRYNKDRAQFVAMNLEKVPYNEVALTTMVAFKYKNTTVLLMEMTKMACIS